MENSEAVKKYHSRHKCCKHCKNCFIRVYPPLISNQCYSHHECSIKRKSVKESIPRWFCGYFEPTDNNNNLPMKRWYIPPPPPRKVD